jgi:hypothetical protein
VEVGRLGRGRGGERGIGHLAEVGRAERNGNFRESFAGVSLRPKSPLSTGLMLPKPLCSNRFGGHLEWVIGGSSLGRKGTEPQGSGINWKGP